MTKPRSATFMFAMAALTFCFAAVRADAAETYGELLGWGPTDKIVIFHSDDAGMSHSMNEGAMRGLTEGLVSSVSIMMPCPWVPEIVDFSRANPDYDFGLHLTLTSEWDIYRWGPVAGKPAVPGLVDAEGCLWDNVPLVVANATPDEIEAEIRAQIDRAETMGLTIGHMDSHMGTLFASIPFFRRYMKVGIEKQIPILVAGGHLTYARAENGDAVDLLGALAKSIWRAGLPVIDDLHTATYGWRDPAEKKENLIHFLRTMKPGITEVIIHCAVPNDVMPKITSSVNTRDADFRAMIDADVKRVVAEEGIILTNWKELMVRRKAAGDIASDVPIGGDSGSE